MENRTQITLWDYIRHCDGLDAGDIKGVAKKIGESLGLCFKKAGKGYTNEKLGLGIILEQNKDDGHFGIRLTDRKGKGMLLSTIADVCDILTKSFIHHGINVKAL